MPAPTLITELSQTAGSNGPTGSVDAPSVLDDYQRAHAAFIAMLRDGKGYTGIVSVASASTTSIGAENSMFLEITGTTTITSFGTTYNGPRYLRFAGALTLTHSSSLNLPGAANITTVAGDTCIALPNVAGNGWNVLAYQSATYTAERARTGTAASGANSDITSLSGLTTPLSVAQGGTGATTAPAAFSALKQAASDTATGVVELATDAEVLAGTDTSRAVTPAGLRAGLSASGTAPVYAARAWVTFDGTAAGPSISPNASGNVSSVTDNGTGYYTVVFTTPIQDTNYAVVIGGASTSSAITVGGVRTAAQGSCVIDVGFVGTGGTIPSDRSLVSVVVFR